MRKTTDAVAQVVLHEIWGRKEKMGEYQPLSKHGRIYHETTRTMAPQLTLWSGFYMYGLLTLNQFLTWYHVHDHLLNEDFMYSVEIRPTFVSNIWTHFRPLPL